MKNWFVLLVLVIFAFSFKTKNEQQSWIRINLLGYKPAGIKVAVLCSKEQLTVASKQVTGETTQLLDFEIIDAANNQIVYKDKISKDFGAYGPFKTTYRLNFSSFTTAGRYYLKFRNIKSPEFLIGEDVYKGAADFCLRYMRQQRSGFNPFLKDSCHTNDGYTMYGPMRDSTHIDVSGGWHDASDYLQYSSTSANATYHLLAAYRDFPTVFNDEKMANGLDGKNAFPDILDEAKWGIDWMMKMNPSSNIMFNQLGDDRDHIGMRLPKQDSFYGKGFERPVYFIDGKPQQRGKFMNNTTGTSSTAAKFAAVFALAKHLSNTDSLFRLIPNSFDYYTKAMEAFKYAEMKPGVTQTVSVRSPYIYAEGNWEDDMELASLSIHNMINSTKNASDNGWYMVKALGYAEKEKFTPWLGADTAKHYQWYPFINIGHYELIKQFKTKQHGPVSGYYKQFIDTFWNNAAKITGYYKEGIRRVWNKASQNAFYRGVPFIWCSNNLTTSFATQCYWYREISGDQTFAALEQANFDWLFGCNPWGSSFVYGLPANCDSPTDPHSAFTHLKNYPIDGGLVDGPVYGSIYKNLIGITLYQPDEYAAFQSDLAVYHDDYGDYSTNEPTMDGTASLIYLLAAKENEFKPVKKKSSLTYSEGAIIKADTTVKKLAIIFTGDEFADGGDYIANVLLKEKTKASFFFTGRFYRNALFKNIILRLKKDGHYLGPHSDQHLLYCDWNKRDSLLVSKMEFEQDIRQNISSMKLLGIENKQQYFIPPYEWWNDSIANWSKENNLTLFNFSPGTKTNADYTWPELASYKSSVTIFKSLMEYEKNSISGLNGAIILIHIGTDPRRTDKFYKMLPQLRRQLQQKKYNLVTIEELLK